ncbi:DUF2158 domain-containing protein [Rosistilla oblonga]
MLSTLNSGGPDMTVSSKNRDYCTCCCVWFDDNNEPKSGHYGAELLDFLRENGDEQPRAQVDRQHRFPLLSNASNRQKCDKYFH